MRFRACESSFEAGTHLDESEPERLVCGLVLGLPASPGETLAVGSGRKRGFCPYDVVSVPRFGMGIGSDSLGSRCGDAAVVMEFQVFDPYEEVSLADTVRRARAQVEACTDLFS